MTLTGVDSIGLTNISGLLAKPNIESGSFDKWFISEIHNTNKLLNSAETDLQNLATGQAESVHEVMLALEKANTAFQLTLQVRNKLLDGYKEIMRMQV